MQGHYILRYHCYRVLFMLPHCTALTLTWRISSPPMYRRRCHGPISSVQNSIVSCHDGRLAYHVAGFIAVRDVSRNVPPTLIPLGVNVRAVTALSASYSAPLLVSAGVVDNTPIITVYDIVARTRRKTLYPPGMEARLDAFKSVAISPDGKLIAGLAGVQEKSKEQRERYRLLIWGLEKGRVLASRALDGIRHATTHEGAHCEFAPRLNTDIGQYDTALSVCFQGNVQMFTMNAASPDSILRTKPINLGKKIDGHVTCQKWAPWTFLSELCFVVGMSSGDVVLVRSGLAKSSLRFGSCAVRALEFVHQGDSLIILLDDGSVLTSKAPDNENGNGNWNSIPEKIFEMTIAPCHRDIMLSMTTSLNKLMMFQNGGLFALHIQPRRKFETISECESSSIISCDVCRGADHVVSLDNEGVISITGILSHRMQRMKASMEKERLFNVSTHPSGSMVAISGATGIKVAFVLHDRLDIVHQVMISQLHDKQTSASTRSCLSVFSNGGQFLAISTPSQIRIIDSYTFEEVKSVAIPQNTEAQNLLGVQWSTDDSMLAVATSKWVFLQSMHGANRTLSLSLDKDDNIKEYGEVTTLAFAVRKEDIIIHVGTDSGYILQYTICVLGETNIHATISGSISLEDHVESLESVPQKLYVSCLCTTGHDLCVGTSDGRFFVFPLPFDINVAPKIMRPSLAALTSIVRSHDIAIVASMDGSMSFISIRRPGTKQSKDQNPNLRLSCTPGGVKDYTLASRSTIESMNSQLAEYSSQLEVEVAEKSAELSGEVSALQQKMQILQEELQDMASRHETERREWNNQVAQKDKQLQQSLFSAEQAFEKRLAVMEELFTKQAAEESARTVAADKKLQEVIEEFENEIRRTKQAHVDEIEASKSLASKDIENERAQRLQLQETLQKVDHTARAEKERWQREAQQQIEEEKNKVRQATEQARNSYLSLMEEKAIHRKRAEEQRILASCATEKVEQLMVEISKLTIEKRRLQGEVAEAVSSRNELSEKVKNHEKSLESAHAKIQELEQYNAEAIETNNRHSEESKKSQEILESAESRYRKLKIELTKSKEMLEKANLRAEEQYRFKKILREQLRTSQQDVAQLKIKIVNMQKDIEHVAGCIQEEPSVFKNAVINLFRMHADTVR